VIDKVDNLHELPKGWAWTSLGKILDFIKGKKPKNLGPKSEALSIPYIDIEAFEDRIVNRFTDGIDCALCDTDDLLVVWDGARCGLVGRGASGAIGSTLGKLVHYEMDSSYLFYFLQSMYGHINKRPRGVGIPHVEPNTFWNINIPIPPHGEQKRIVAMLEELFARLDAGVGALRKVKAQLKRYRQAVLKYAFEGKLTEKWRKNHRDLIEPASQLVNSIIKGNLAEWENDQLLQVKKSRQDQKNHLLEKKYKQPLLPSTSTQAGLPEYWAWVTADQLFWSITSGSRGWAKYYSEEGAFFVRVGDLSHDNISIDLKSAQHVNPPDGAELRRTRVSSGDILISITADIGRIALVPIGIKEAYINQHVALAKSVSLFSHSHLAWFLLSPIGQKQLTGLQYGATKAGLGLDDIRRVNIPLAPLVEQYEIVEEIERRLSVLTEAEKVIEQNLKRANSLRQSILGTAFEGRLVPQNPEDEPADKLLERIREERAKSMGEKNTNKRRKNKLRQLELSTYVK